MHGKELSFNNLLDLDAGRRLLREFELPACAIVKHNNPCGVGVGETALEAYSRALACDPASAYGGVVVFNREVDHELGAKLNENFVELIFAPGYEHEAIEIIRSKPHVRVIEDSERRKGTPGERDLRRVSGGLLVQDLDTDIEDRSHMEVVTERKPTEEEWGELQFAWKVCKHVRSNAIVLAKGLATIGIGAGQMSRVDSVRLAVEKARENRPDQLQGSAMASDAFFPFADGVEAGIEAGVTAVIQPGGSRRDPEVIEACNRAGIAMVFTGRRHFRH
jgi:phosphoribosylaminoimidazolecarboxamide formyltransferase/IMP cyclohydrolase